MCKMCLFCVGKNPTNLKSHIARQHKDIYSLLAKKEVEMKASKPTIKTKMQELELKLK